MAHRLDSTRRDFLRTLGPLALSTALAPGCAGLLQGRGKRPNLVLITADDLNCDFTGAFGCKVQGATPNIDRLASQGIRFTRAHVTVAVCQPCRGALATGRYPHRSGIEGFNHIEGGLPTLMECLAEAGYLTGILGKVGHSTPKKDFAWDMKRDMGELRFGRDPDRYHGFSREFFDRAGVSGKPFYLMANSHDPHRPFSGSDQEKKKWPDEKITAPSRSFAPSEVEVPGFLPDLSEVRLEIAEYMSSVRRCDDTAGAVLRALAESGRENDTLVMFLSDHGMPLPFAKTNCYLHSTRTPWIVRWPGVVRPGSVDGRHFISGIDFMPTVLEAANLPKVEGMDGFSFLPLLRGERQEGRDQVFTQFHETSAKRRYPMRCIQNRRYGYIFNPWSDGEREFRNESQSGRTFKAMEEAAGSSTKIAARVRMFRYRVLEEFYDLERDPDALVNLIDHPECRDAVEAMRSALAGWMRRTGDPALEAFLNRQSREALDAFMAEQQAEADRRKRKAGPGTTG